ncbi:AIR synthase related protein, partial [Pseudomonas helleri]|uniref:AIR synthase related protein n=1 Tax=Pseudomonas helleri TaxID=1608996 RepID=UPI003FCF9750
MTTMSELGEKAFLKMLLPDLYVAPSFVNGFGHDASIMDFGLEKLLAFKIDRAPYPVALQRGIGDYKTWGRLAVAANVSDLLAVGATPRALMLSLVLPGHFEIDNASAIIKGCEEACIAHGIAFVGGDIRLCRK